MMFTIRRWIELDAGHRVPYHGSKCRHLHGHRYRAMAVVTSPDGQVVPAASKRSDAGMIADFGVIKQVLTTVVHDPFDHKLLLWEQDPLANDPGFHLSLDGAELWEGGVVIVPCIPTAEELARYWGQEVAAELTRLATGLRLASMEVRETPTSFATWSPNKE